MNIIQKNIEAIKRLCEKYHVKKLFVFGSVLTDRFGEQSDVDFVVEFNAIDLYSYAENYWNLKENLEMVLERPVDLLEKQTIKNPHLLGSINKNRDLVYG